MKLMKQYLFIINHSNKNHVLIIDINLKSINNSFLKVHGIFYNNLYGSSIPWLLLSPLQNKFPGSSLRNEFDTREYLFECLLYELLRQQNKIRNLQVIDDVAGRPLHISSCWSICLCYHFWGVQFINSWLKLINTHKELISKLHKNLLMFGNFQQSCEHILMSDFA